MEEIRGIDALFAAWEASPARQDTIDAFRQWRGDHLCRHREFAALTQREMGQALGLSQAMYTKFEQDNSWGTKYTGPICCHLKVPGDMLQNQTKARAFFSRDGGLTFIRLVEAVMDRWGDEGERAAEQLKLPIQLIQDRLDAERKIHQNDERPDKVSAFLAEPVVNDLDQDTKRWVEQLLDLGPGTLVDSAHYVERRTERRAIQAKMRRHFLSNVERLLEERRWTPADLAMRSCLPLAAVADVDGKLLFQPLCTAQVAGVAMAFDIDPSLLTMQNGTDMQRESAAAFQDLPAMPRSFIGWLYGILPKTGEERPAAGGTAVAAMLPMFRAMMEQVVKDANRSSQVADAMNAVFSAYVNQGDSTQGHDHT